jgi:5-carboxymethyl-2-hydroxymuconate isomerase
MPHLTLEYSANLDDAVDFDALCRALLAALMASGLVERGAPRVRAIRCEAYAIADEMAENSFIDMSLRLGAGRSHQEKRDLGDALIAAARPLLSLQLAQPHFALSLEVREIDQGLSWKLNTMHARLRA